MGEGRAERTREIQDLEFLVGTSCSRAITLLMQPDRSTPALRDELEFLADKAARLARLLAEDASETSGGR